MRLTEFAPALASEPPPEATPEKASAPPPEATAEKVSAPPPEPSAEQASQPLVFGPPRWARRSWTSGFAGSDFVPQPDGTLRCPAGHPLTVQERRPERNGSVRMVYGARLGHCRPCPLREQCQEATTTLKPRQVSAVLWPIESCAFTPALPPPQSVEASSACLGEPPPVLPPPQLAPDPILWGDWPRCHLRRQWMRLLRPQTVTLTCGSAKFAEQKEEEAQHAHLQTRAQRAHWRLSWHERMARKARLSTASPLEVTLHGLPAAFAQSFGWDVVTAAETCRNTVCFFFWISSCLVPFYIRLCLCSSVTYLLLRTVRSFFRAK